MAKRSKKNVNTTAVENAVGPAELVEELTKDKIDPVVDQVVVTEVATDPVSEQAPVSEDVPVADSTPSEEALVSADTPIDPAVLQPEVEVHTGEILESAPDYVYLCVDGIHLDVAFNKSGLNIHVQDSYQLSKKSQISVALDLLMDTEAMANMRAAGFKRSRHSMFIEWAAHNTLYRWGREPERTGSVDIDQSETLGRRFLYYILAMFCPR